MVVSPITAGSYRCVAGVRDRDLQFPEVVGKMQVLVKGPPTIVSSAEQSGRPGGIVRLECNTVSVPSPIKMTWFYKGRIIDLGEVLVSYQTYSNREVKETQNSLNNAGFFQMNLSTRKLGFQYSNKRKLI